MMILDEVETKRKVDVAALKATTYGGRSHSLGTKSEMTMASLSNMMAAINRVVVLEIPDTELEGRSRELGVEKVELAKH